MADSSENRLHGIRPDILNYDDIRKMIPALDGHRKLVERVMKWLWLDKCNAVHARYCDTTGVTFAHRLVTEEYRFQLRVDNEEVFSRFRSGAFVTVSNHPFGSYDGILLLDLVGKYRPDYKVMVNMILNNISAMRPSFIAVDALQTDDPERKKVSMQGIREAMRCLAKGSPVGFFPAGAVSKIDSRLRVRDRLWQPTVIRIIEKAGVPVIPVYFHGHNSTLFNILGMIDWRLRTLRLPRELFNMTGKPVHISVGDPIMPEEQARHISAGQLGEFLRSKTYELEKIK